MTSKEKAQELVHKFQELNRSKISDYSRIEFPTAKQCALIAVDEILKSDWFIPTKEDYVKWLSYWEEVKQEIEKL